MALYDTGNVAGVDEVFAPDLIDHNAVAGAALGDRRHAITGRRGARRIHRQAAPDPVPAVASGAWVVRRQRQPGRDQRHRHRPCCRRQITEIYHVEELLELTQQISTGAQPV
nr:hypothetical protein GCM10017611_07350 [Rhodococcus wratislaviensis]